MFCHVPSQPSLCYSTAKERIFSVPCKLTTSYSHQESSRSAEIPSEERQNLENKEGNTNGTRDRPCETERERAELWGTRGVGVDRRFWRKSLIGYSPWGRKESDMTERIHFTSLGEQRQGEFSMCSLGLWE